MLDKLEKYYEDGLLMKQVHPKHDLTIWNYSPKVQYDRLWDEITIQCRGLVTNSKGEIVARPFKKFFNYDEIKDTQYPYCESCRRSGMINCGYFDECGGWEMRSVIPNEPFEVFEKIDGSLGIVFHYNGELILATRGSFTSPQAVKGLEIAYRKALHYKILKGYTYLYEIIYPENRIVVDYGDQERLVLLSIINTETGEELPYDEYEDYDVVKKYDGINDYGNLKNMISNDAEGFVIRFKNGFRMKIKGDEYCRLHKILTNVSNRDIWEYLKNGKPLDDILEKVPDEFYNWVRKTIIDFENKHEEIMGQVITDYWEIDADMVNEDYELTRRGMDLMSEREYAKKYAELAKTKKYPHLLFSYRKEILNPIKTSNKIWDMLYPDYQKPFKKDDE